MHHTLPRAADEKINLVTSLPFLLVHLIPLLAIVTGVTWTSLALFGGLYAVRMFAITAGYHRYFSHRSYRTNRAVQFLLGFLGTTAVQKGPLWWASHHRAHHRYSDTDLDVHSPQKGFWWSHVGWILCDKHNEADLDAVRDLAAYPELRFLERFDWIGPWTVGVASFLIGGWSGLVFGFFGSTVLLWHATFTVNSLNHTWGSRRYATTDTSRNNPFLALLTFGEGWHNNHHHFQASARQGFYWWELDLSWYALRSMRALRLVRGLRQPPADALQRDRIADGAFDIGMFRAAFRRAGQTVTRSRGRITPTVAAARDAVASGHAGIEAAIDDKRAALEQFVSASMDAAEDLAKTTRRAARGMST